MPISSTHFATGLCVAVLMASLVPANAIDRVRSDQLTCTNVQAVVENQGAVILRYPSTRVPNYFLYDRYVSGINQCSLGQELKRDTVPAADTASCVVYSCQQREPKFNQEWIFRD